VLPPSFTEAAALLADTGRAFHARGWAPATAGNYSAVLARAPLALAVSASGVDKAVLDARHFVAVDADGRVTAGHGRPSDETAVHLAVVRARAAGAVLHTHSVWSTVLSHLSAAGTCELRGFELLKALAGVTTHEHVERLPVVENTQDYGDGRLGRGGARRRTRLPRPAAARARLYAWGRDVAEARRHVEALEFLFEVVGRTLPVPVHTEVSMARVSVPSQGRTIEATRAVAAFLAAAGIEHERWRVDRPGVQAAAGEDVLRAFASEVDALKGPAVLHGGRRRRHPPADAGLEAMLERFAREHWHDEDESGS
jgi:methylthioribulose-1-phosphate dehydratase